MNVSNAATTKAARPHPTSASDDALAPLCRAGLRRTFNPDTALFDRQIRHGRLEPTRGPEDLTSTCICLIGLDRQKARHAQDDLPASRRTILDSAHALAKRRRYTGAFGLLAWANAVHDGRDIDDLAASVGVSLSEDGLCDRLTTMELAWLLSGLLHEAARTGKGRDRDRARAAALALGERYNPGAGVMRHASPKAPLRIRFRSSIANFADQIYAVQALAFAAIVLSHPLHVAIPLAQGLADRQGPLGQWWWHYDARTGATAETYPVYAVHQHAMAPMAFMALAAAGGPRYGAAIEKGLAWLRANELGIDMVDPEAGTIWRDIHRVDGHWRSLARKARELAGAGVSGEAAPPRSLALNRETRPYEWAWRLYAHAIETQLDRGGHIA